MPLGPWVLHLKLESKEYPTNIDFHSLGHRLELEGQPCDWEENIANTSAFSGCVFGDPEADRNIVLIGDSHSIALSYELDRYAKLTQAKVYWLKMAGCQYLPNVVGGRNPPRVDCQANHDELLDFVRSKHAEIVLTYRWTFRLYPVDGTGIVMPYENSEGPIEREPYRETFVYENGSFQTNSTSKADSLTNYINSLAAVSSSLNLIYPVPETAINILYRNSRHWSETGAFLEDLSMPTSDYDERNSFVIELFDDLENSKVQKIRLRELFCEVEFQERCTVQYGQNPLYLDDDHLADAGTKRILTYIFGAY